MSKLHDIQNSYGNNFSIIVANTYSYNIMNASGLPKSSIIIAAPFDKNSYEDVGKYSMIVTDYEGNPVRLTYSFETGNGLKFENDQLKFTIDENTIVDENQKLTATLSNIIDMSTLTSVDGKIFVNSQSLGNASQYEQGLYRIDNNSIQSFNGMLHVDMSGLDHASDNLPGVVEPDNITVVADNGVLSIITENLQTGTNTSYGVIKVDNSTIHSVDGVLKVDSHDLKGLRNDGKMLVKGDDSTIRQNNGELSFDESSIPYASSSNFGKVKIDPDTLYVDQNGILHPKQNNNMAIIYDYNEALDELENRVAVLDEMVNNGLVSMHNDIYSFTLNDAAIFALEPPEYLEEPIYMQTQRVHISLNIITNCDFTLNFEFTDNETPLVEIMEISYDSDTIVKTGIEALNFVWPSTQMLEKQITVLLSAKNFYSSTQFLEYITTKLKITAASATNVSICESIMYSIIRYNSAFNRDNDADLESSNVSTSTNYIANLDRSSWKIIGRENEWNSDIWPLITREMIYEVESDSNYRIIFTGVYTDSRTNRQHKFNINILPSELSSFDAIGQIEHNNVVYDYALYYLNNTIDGEDLFYSLKYEKNLHDRTVIRPRRTTVYSGHVFEIEMSQYIGEDENLQYYIEGTDPNYTFNSYMQYVYPYFGNDPATSYIVPASNESYSFVRGNDKMHFHPRDIQGSYCYFESQSSMNVKTYFFPAGLASQSEYVFSYSSILNTAYVDVRLRPMVNEVECRFTYDQGLIIQGTMKYSYVIDGVEQLVNMSRMNDMRNIILPIKLQINGETKDLNFEGIGGNNGLYEFSYQYRNFNPEDGFSGALIYEHHPLLHYDPIEEFNRISYSSNPILNIDGGISFSYSSSGETIIIGEESISTDNISGMSISEMTTYVPDKIVVEYKFNNNVSLPECTVNNSNEFNFTADFPSRLNVSTRTAMYNFTTQTVEHFDFDNQTYSYQFTFDSNVATIIAAYSYNYINNSYAYSDPIGYIYYDVPDFNLNLYTKLVEFTDSTTYTTTNYIRNIATNSYTVFTNGSSYYVKNLITYTDTSTYYYPYTLNKIHNLSFNTGDNNFNITDIDNCDSLNVTGSIDSDTGIVTIDINIDSAAKVVNNPLATTPHLVMSQSLTALPSSLSSVYINPGYINCSIMNDGSNNILQINHRTIAGSQMQQSHNITNMFYGVSLYTTASSTCSKERFYGIGISAFNPIVINLTEKIDVLKCLIMYMLLNNELDIDPTSLLFFDRSNLIWINSITEFIKAYFYIEEYNPNNTITITNLNGTFHMEENDYTALKNRAASDSKNINCAIVIYVNSVYYIINTSLLNFVELTKPSNIGYIKYCGFSIPTFDESNLVAANDCMPELYNCSWGFSNTKVTVSNSSVNFYINYIEKQIYSTTLSHIEVINENAIRNTFNYTLFDFSELFSTKILYGESRSLLKQTDTTYYINHSLHNTFVLRDYVCRIPSPQSNINTYMYNIGSQINDSYIGFEPSTYKYFLFNSYETYWYPNEGGDSFVLCQVHNIPARYDLLAPLEYEINSYQISLTPQQH